MLNDKNSDDVSGFSDGNVINIFDIAAHIVKGKPAAAPEINPFISSLNIETRKKTVKSKVDEIFNAEGVSIDLKAMEVREVAYVDKEKFVKILNKAFVHCYNLPAAGQKMFWVVLSEVGKCQGQDYVYLEFGGIVRDGAYDIGKTTFYAGVQALIKAGFISQRKQKHTYWINPNLIFNGDRITLAKTYIVKNKLNILNEIPTVNRPGLGPVKSKPRSGDKAKSKAKATFLGG